MNKTVYKYIDKLPLEVMLDNSISSNAKVVYAILWNSAQYHNAKPSDKGTTTLSQGQIAEMLEFSLKTVQRVFKELRDMKLIEKVACRRSNVGRYLVNILNNNEVLLRTTESQQLGQQSPNPINKKLLLLNSNNNNFVDGDEIDCDLDLNKSQSIMLDIKKYDQALKMVYRRNKFLHSDFERFLEFDNWEVECIQEKLISDGVVGFDGIINKQKIVEMIGKEKMARHLLDYKLDFSKNDINEFMDYYFDNFESFVEFDVALEKVELEPTRKKRYFEMTSLSKQQILGIMG